MGLLGWLFGRRDDARQDHGLAAPPAPLSPPAAPRPPESQLTQHSWPDGTKYYRNASGRPVKADGTPLPTRPRPSMHPVPEDFGHMLALKGVSNYAGRDKMRVGQELPVTLEREPKNEYDPNAIVVKYRGTKVGYISAAKAKSYAPIMDDQQRPTFDTVAWRPDKGKIWVRIPKMGEMRSLGPASVDEHSDRHTERDG